MLNAVAGNKNFSVTVDKFSDWQSVFIGIKKRMAADFFFDFTASDISENINQSTDFYETAGHLLKAKNNVEHTAYQREDNVLRISSLCNHNFH